MNLHQDPLTSDPGAETMSAVHPQDFTRMKHHVLLDTHGYEAVVDLKSDVRAAPANDTPTTPHAPEP